MKRILVLLVTALCVGGALSGCVVVPAGGYYHGYYRY
jgi:hypothetical protein